MEDKKTFLAFIIITSILNISLLVLFIRGLTIYISNLQINETSKLKISEFNSLINDLKYRINSPAKDVTILKDKFNSQTSVASYIEKLSFKTNEKNIQILKNVVILSSSNEIIINLELYGNFENIVNLVKEVENELPLTEIQESKIEINNQVAKVNLKIRILIDQND